MAQLLARTQVHHRLAVIPVRPFTCCYCCCPFGRLPQSKPLYDAFKAVREGPLWEQLTEAQQRVITGELRDFVLGGVALEVGGLGRAWLQGHARGGRVGSREGGQQLVFPGREGWHSHVSSVSAPAQARTELAEDRPSTSTESTVLWRGASCHSRPQPL